MKKYILLLAAVGLLAMACNKELDTQFEEINTQEQEIKYVPITMTATYGVGTKVNYTESGSSISAKWQNGDQIIVVYDGMLSTLTTTDDDTASAIFTGSVAYTSNAPKSTSMLICYVKDQNNASAATINTDGSYTYNDGILDGQDGTLAGAAKINIYYGAAQFGDGEHITCNFNVNTSICKFNLKNVDADAGKKASLAYKSNDQIVSRAEFTVTTGDNLVYLAIPSGHYSGEQTLVYRAYEYGRIVDEKHLKLNRTQGNLVAGQTYSKDVTLLNAGEGALPGVFRVPSFYGSTGSPVDIHFSRGNLQYVAENTWKFADNQYDCFGNAQSDNHRDLFGWGTNAPFIPPVPPEGFVPKSPNMVSKDHSDYKLHGEDDIAHDEFYELFWYARWHDRGEWGRNAIVNGGNEEIDGRWYTPSAAQWKHIIEDRANAANLYALATIGNTYQGLVLLPDNWSTSPSGCTFTAGYSSGWTTNSYTMEQWNAMEAAGAVFLPDVRWRFGSDLIQEGMSSYWTMTGIENNEGQKSAYSLTFNSGEVTINRSWLRCYGLAVRLVYCGN
jgi:hypothetical protein